MVVVIRRQEEARECVIHDRWGSVRRQFAQRTCDRIGLAMPSLQERSVHPREPVQARDLTSDALLHHRERIVPIGVASDRMSTRLNFSRVKTPQPGYYL